MELAKRIRLIRKAKNLSQAEVAYRINMSPSAYGQIERRAGKSAFETLEKISVALDVSINFLIDLDNKNYIDEKYKL